MNSGNKVDLETYKAIVKSVPFGLIIVDKNGNFLLSNNKVIGLNEEELEYYRTHRNSKDIGLYSLDKETLCKFDELPLDLAMNGKTIRNKKYYIKNIFVPNGLYIKVNAFPVSQNDEITGATLIYEDITEEQTMLDSMMKTFNEITNHLRNLIEHEENQHLNSKT